MKVYEALAKAFKAEGTSAVFGIMGDANQYWIDAIVKNGISMYEVRHEGAGLSMADGWARINGSPGVATTTSGPGTTQLATAMVIAARAQTPLVAFCGDANWLRGEGSQVMNMERFAAAIECGFVRVKSAEDAYDAVQRAFYLARQESRPIMLTAAQDVQQLPFDDDFEYVPSTALLNNAPIYPNPDVIARAADIITSSTHPVIIVGRGAIASGAGDAVLKLAHRSGALLVTSLLALNWLRDSYDYHAGVSGLYASKASQEILQEADCVIGIGASLNHYTTEHGYLYPDAKFVHFDVKPQIIMGDGRPADCYVHSDARLGIEVLDTVLEERAFHQVGFRTPEIKELLATALEDPAVYEIEEGTIDPREATRVLDDALPAEIPLVFGVGHYSHFPQMLCQRERPYIMINKHFGSIGEALVTAIGACVASGNQPTALFEGDASFMMHLAEFETAVRYNLPLFTVVFNDEGLGAEAQKAAAKGLDASLPRIPTPNLGVVGEALGARGRQVRSLDELRAATAEFVANPGPMLVDLRMSLNVIAIQYRRLWYGDESA